MQTNVRKRVERGSDRDNTHRGPVGLKTLHIAQMVVTRSIELSGMHIAGRGCQRQLRLHRGEVVGRVKEAPRQSSQGYLVK